jgi:hypothetical protein
MKEGLACGEIVVEMTALAERFSTISKTRGAAAALACALAAIGLSARLADAQEAQGAASEETAADDSGQPESEFLQPRNLMNISPQYRESNGSTRPLDTYQFKFRTDRKIPLNEQWTLGLRLDVPVLARNPLNASNPTGDYIAGLGNVDAQTSIIDKIDNRWTTGAGVRIYAPSRRDGFGSGKWQIMPGAGFRYALPEISGGSYIEPVLRYDQSFAGDPLERGVSNLQFAPTVNFGLPRGWFLTLYPSPDIRWNFGDPVTGETGHLFLPIDAKIGRKLADEVSVSLEVGAPIIRDYPAYNFKAILSFSASY